MSAAGLIAAVRRRRALWDPTDPHHHNRATVAGLWRQIGSELGINMMVAKSKWRGLRDYYRQQLKRALDQPESVAVSHWAHFQEMSFLGPSMSSSANKSIKMEEEEETETEDERWSWGQGESEDGPEPDSEDDDLLFFRSLLPDLRGLPRQKKAWIRLQIQQIVFQEVYSGRKSPCQENSRNSVHSPTHCSSPVEMPCKVEIQADTD